jgi:hypothetical protein
MSRRSLISVIASVPLLLAAGALGCTRSNLATVEFGSLCAPTTDCTFQGTCDAVDIGGQLAVDLQYTPMLVWPIEMFNQRQDPTDEAGRVNTNSATVHSFEMRYDAGGASIPNATSPQTIRVPANGSTVAAVILIPPTSSASAALAALPAGTYITVKVKARGDYDDGTEFETGEYIVTVVLANGQFNPTDPTNPLSGYKCSDTTQTPTSICPPNPGQDGTVVCK